MIEQLVLCRDSCRLASWESGDAGIADRVEYLSESWKRLPSLEVKREVLINQIRPFKFTEDDVDRLMSKLDRRSSEAFHVSSFAWLALLCQRGR